MNFYNKFNKFIDIADEAPRLKDIPLSKSMYYYDLMEHGRYFPRDFRLNYVFGDIRSWKMPDRPSFLKSRVSVPGNANGVLLKMSKFRLYFLPPDTRPFSEKKPIAVWRGNSNNPRRIALCHKHKNHPLCDVALTAGSDDADASVFLQPSEQMAYRYIICIEGNDVASNLAWTMASNSLCMMPVPANESWFMESRLEPGKHFVALDDDFDNLPDKIEYFERHPKEAAEIIGNANRFVSQFLDERREQVISMLVMYKYFVATRQIEADEKIAELIWP